MVWHVYKTRKVRRFECIRTRLHRWSSKEWSYRYHIVTISRLWYQRNHAITLTPSFFIIKLAFHNWITLYFYEKAKKFDYKSFVPIRRQNNDDQSVSERVINLRFSFEGFDKSFSTSFMGTTPEFEVSLYTLLFLCKRQNTRVTLDDIHLNIRVYDFYERSDTSRENRLLGSAFPMIAE